MNWSTIMLLCCVLLVPVTGWAQDERLVRRLDPDVRDAVSALIDSAGADQLPVEPLVDKALEGASKGAAGEAIVQAVRDLRDALAGSRDALGQGADEAAITAGAAALRLGVTQARLREVAAGAGGGNLSVRLSVLADLVALGVPDDTAATALLTLSRAGAADAQLLELRERVQRDVVAGVRPSVAMRLRLRGFPVSLPPPRDGGS
jgi:hypothetical protein